MINKLGKPLGFTQKGKKRKYSNKIRNGREVIQETIIIQEYRERLYTSKSDYLEEKDKLLEIYNLPRLNHEELENFNTLIKNKEIEAVINNMPKSKSPGTRWLH